MDQSRETTQHFAVWCWDTWTTYVKLSLQVDFCWTSHCNCVNNWYCVLLAGWKIPNGHFESNKILNFTANFTLKRFLLSHFGVKFQLSFSVEIKNRSISSWKWNISVFPKFLTSLINQGNSVKIKFVWLESHFFSFNCFQLY